MDPLSKNRLGDNLSRSEEMVELYLNKKKESKLINRIKKFLKQPYKYVYHNAYKVGLVQKNEVDIKTFWGSTVRLPISDENVVLLYYCGSLGIAECRLARFLLKNLDSGDCFYDIGANYGFYTSLAAHLVGAEGEVHVFEPNPSTMKYIRNNTKAQAGTKIFLNEIALSDSAGEVSFFDTSVSDKSGLSTMLLDVAQKNPLAFREIKVQSMLLDEYVKEHKIPKIIKIDVEGSEYKVLGGATSLLRDFAPIITMEVWDAPHVIAHAMKAVEILTKAGYKSYEITASGDTKRQDVVPGAIGEYDTFVFRK